MAATGLPNTSVLLAFLLSVIIAGANAVAVSFTVVEMPLFWGATLLLAVLSRVAGEAWLLPQQSQTWAAVLYLIIFGSVVLFYLAVYVVQHWTATASSCMMVLSPFAAVPLGALLTEEQITAGLLIGAVLVLVGAYVGALSGGTNKQVAVKASPTET